MPEEAKKIKILTLLELLIVIAIIIFLVLISIIALNDQRAKARDSKRISDIRQLRTALEFYYNDEGEYPVIDQVLILGSERNEKLCSKQEGAFVPKDNQCAPETTWMSEVPADPLADRTYSYIGAAEGYDITFTTEKDSALGPPGTYHAHSEIIDKEAGNK